MMTRQQRLEQIHWNDCKVYDKNDKTNCAYLIELYKGEKRKWLKVGYSGGMETRMIDHLRNKKFDIDRIEVIKVWEFSNKDSALSMENTLRRYFKNKGNGLDYTPQDRFGLVEVDSEDLWVLDTKAKMVEVL